MTDYKWRQLPLEARTELQSRAAKQHWLTVDESVVHQVLNESGTEIEPYQSRNNGLAPNDKPLNQTQVKNLTAIVEGDMRSLQDAVVADIERRVRHRLEQVEQEFGAVEGWESWRSRYTELVDHSISARSVGRRRRLER